jgi:6-phosphogluconolactonase
VNAPIRRSRVRNVLVGGFSAPAGTCRGISLIRHDPATHSLQNLGLIIPTESPSYIAVSADRRTLYCVNELERGAVSAYRARTPLDVATDEEPVMEHVGSAESGGSLPCHLALHPNERYLFVANYGSGTLAVIRLSDDGAIGSPCDYVQLVGSGPCGTPQQHSRAHMVVPYASGSRLAVTDLGADRVWRFSFDAGPGRLRPIDSLQLRSGSGTREIAIDESARRAYVLGEFDGTIATVDWSDVTRTTSVGQGSVTAPTSIDHASTLLLEGGLVYATHRARNLLSVLRIEDGRTRPLADLHTHGDWPRHAAVRGSTVYVANQRSDRLTTLELDVADMDVRVSRTDDVTVPSPTCVILA